MSINKIPAPESGRTDLFGAQELTKWIPAQNYLPPIQHLQPATPVQFGLGAALPHSHTPSLRVAGFEDEDDEEYENEAPLQGAS